MIDFIKDMWTDDWLGKTLLIFMGMIAALVLFGVLWFLHWAVDSWFQPQQIGTGTVTSKNFTPAYTSMTWISTVNGGGYPLYSNVPDSWTVVFSVFGKSGGISVTHDFFNKVRTNDRYQIKYHEGRISNALYVDDIL